MLMETDSSRLARSRSLRSRVRNLVLRTRQHPARGGHRKIKQLDRASSRGRSNQTRWRWPAEKAWGKRAEHIGSAPTHTSQHFRSPPFRGGRGLCRFCAPPCSVRACLYAMRGLSDEYAGSWNTICRPAPLKCFPLGGGQVTETASDAAAGQGETRTSPPASGVPAPIADAAQVVFYPIRFRPQSPASCRRAAVARSTFLAGDTVTFCRPAAPPAWCRSWEHCAVQRNTVVRGGAENVRRGGRNGRDHRWRLAKSLAV